MEISRYLIVLTIVSSAWSQRIEENPCKGIMKLTFMPNTEACEKYIMCVGGMPRNLECQAGKWFSATLKQCLPKEEVNCRFNDPKTRTTMGRAADDLSTETVPSTTVAATTQAPTTIQTTTIRTTTTTTRTTSKPTTPAPTTQSTTTTKLLSTTTAGSSLYPEISCPATNPRDVHFIASPTDCGVYYLCYNGDPVQLMCSSGMHWNSKARMCDTPKNANCKIGTSTPPRYDCPNTGLAFIPHSVNCNWYFFCNEGIPLLQQCPFLHYFDVDKRRCALRFSAKCALAVRRERI